MTTDTDTAAALWTAIDAYGCDAASNGALGRDGATRVALARAITAHVEAEVARRLAPNLELWRWKCSDETVEQAIERLVRERNEYAEKLCERNAALVMAPDVEAAIAQIVACTDLMDNAGSARAREALRAAIAADRARAVAEALDGAGRAERFADAICLRVGARDSGCGGQTVEAGTARLYADATARIDAMIERATARPTPDEARSIGRVAEHLRCLAAEVEPSRMADGFEADRMRLLAHRLRQVAALMPDSDEARRLVETAIGAGMNLACHGDWSDEQRAADRAHAATARTALLRALGVEA